MRVVSLVPSWTETLVAWGVVPVAVTRWCVHPAERVARIEKVGGTKDPDVARIAALAPDLVVCEKEENRKVDVEALREAGLRVLVSDVRSLEDAARDAQALGQAVGRATEGAALAARILDAAKAAPRGPGVPVFVPIWRRPWMTPTRDTYADAMLAAAGARNVFRDAEGRYPERTPLQAREAGATHALLPTEPYPFHEKLDAAREELVEAGFAPENVALVDGEALTWYGVRTPEGLRVVREAVTKLRV